METSQTTRGRGATTQRTSRARSPSLRTTNSASSPASPNEVAIVESAPLKRKATSDSETDDEGSTHHVPAKSSAYALLALMTSVQQAAQASADERSRTNESYKIWKTTTTTNESNRDHVKKRKPTHTVRKEEITTLNNEIVQLEKRLAFLRGQTIAKPPGTDLLHGSADPEHPYIPNALLREAIHEQQLSLACARSMVTQFFASDFALPAHCYIHLTKSRKDRLRTLQAIKPQQLRIARRYLLERSRHLDLTKPHAASEQFISEAGDACCIRFSLVQFLGDVSVRKVFEAATFYTSNLEISFTDGSGRLTIREDDDDHDDPTIEHHRTVTTVNANLQIEASLAMFTHFDHDDDFGIVTSTFVDRDDLYPYRPHERLRKDITAALCVSKEQGCVVMRRLGHVRIHSNEHHPITNELAKALSEGLSHWGDALVKYAKQHCGLERAE